MESKFIYGQEVKITKGFFKGLKGKIIGTKKWMWTEREYVFDPQDSKLCSFEVKESFLEYR